MSLAIVLPVLDEEREIAATLSALAPLRARGAEVVVVDGGSRDRTVAIAGALCDRMLSAPRGRASQMNAGAAAARAELLLFLHADSRLPDRADRLVREALAGECVWGRFDVRIVGRHRMLPLVAAGMNLRSRLTGIATGDQAMFVRRAAFAAVGGFPDLPLMEDIALSRRLKRVGRPACLRGPVLTSGRRWDTGGLLRTVLKMWRLRLAYAFGISPDRLARSYGYAPRQP